MVGQGGPKSSPRPLLRYALYAAHWLMLWVAAAARAEQPPTMRLRIAWGGGEARQWHGKISVSPGELANFEPLGIEADESASLWQAPEGIVVRQASPRTYDGFDIDVAASLDATLSVELESDDPQQIGSLQVPLSRLVGESATQDLDDTGNRIIARRAPGDQLQVSFDRDHLVYRPGETFTCQISPRLVDVSPGEPVRYALRLRDPLTQRLYWQDDVESVLPGNSESGAAIPIELNLPNVEGACNLEIELTSKPNLLKLGQKQVLASRMVQLVVLSDRARDKNETNPQSPVLVLEIDPLKPRWWERFATIPSIPGLRKGAFGTGDTHPWQHALGPMVQLAPGRSPSAPSWEAYPLAVHRLGVPHVVEIEYPSDVPQTVALSLIETNAAGSVPTIGLDSGFSVPDDAASMEPKLLTHRLVFWPRTRSPVLLIANLRGDSQAVYGKVRVFAHAARLPAARPVPRRERLLAGYYNRPLFAENFCAPEAFDQATGRSLDDWNTFYVAGNHLVNYLQHVGFDGLMLSVLADGGCIYPSRQIQSTPRYDNGVFFSTGQDPVRKDVLELLFRMFDREEMKLIPAVSFSTPLPQLEALKRQSETAASGIEWVGRDGARWLDRNRPSRGLAPYYNPLHPAVQDAMQGVIEEIAQRYAKHPSFAGIALQLSSDSFAQLPGLAWGFDDETIAAFEQDTGVKLTAAGSRRFAARATELLGAYRKPWTEWRAARLSAFLKRLEERVSQIRPGAILYLAGAGMFDNSELQSTLRPTLPPRPFDEALFEVGIDPNLAAGSPDVVLLRPQQLSPSGAHLVDLKINDSPELDRRLRSAAHSSALFYHEPYKAPLPSFDQRGPFQNSHLWLIAQISPSGARNRQRFVHTIAALDPIAMFDGGWLLSLGQEAPLADLIDTYRRLPAGTWSAVSLQTQPVTIRTTAQNNQSYLYLANDCPWSVDVVLDFTAPDGTELTELTGRRPLGEVDRRGTTWQWRLKLDAFDLFAVTASSPAIQVIRADVSLPIDVESQLENRIQDFQARAMALQNQPPLEGLRNAGFELPADPQGAVPGWTLSDQQGIAAALDKRQRHAGAQALRLSSNGAAGLLISDEIKVPATGRMETSLWLRLPPGRKELPLRVALEGTHNGEAFYRRAELAPAAPPAGTGEWSLWSAKFDTMPLDGTATVRVRMELAGRLETWIDDVQLNPLHFSEDERLELFKLGTSAQLKLKEGYISDCLRLLEGYWPQFLTTHVSLTETPVAQRPPERQALVPAKRETAPANGTGLWDRVRRAIPNILR